MLAKVKAALHSLAAKATPIARAQTARFIRLFAAAVVSTGVFDQLLKGGFTRTTVIGAAVGAFEVAFRKFIPAHADNSIVQMLLDRVGLLEHRLIAHLSPAPTALPVASGVEPVTPEPAPDATVAPAPATTDAPTQG